MNTTYCKGVLMIDPNRVLSRELVDKSYKRLINILEKGGASDSRILNVSKCYNYLKDNIIPPYQRTLFSLDNLSREMKSFSNFFNNTGNENTKSYSYAHSKSMVYNPESKKYNVVEKEQKNGGPVTIKKYLKN